MEADPPTWFHLGIVAPVGFEAPDLGSAVWRHLHPLLRPRRNRREVPALVGVLGEPVTAAMGEMFRERDWHASSIARHPERYLRVGHRAACAQVAVQVDAVVMVHADPLDDDMRAVLEWCDWLGVAWRTIRVPAGAV